MRLLTLAVLSLGSGALAADCLQGQKRQGDKPTGDQISKALKANSALDQICSGNWRTGDEQQLENTFNHWSIFLSVQRTDKTKDLANCKGAFEQIIEQCITGGNFWGGSWTYGGESYNISNSVYPNNGLSPYDDGGPPDPSITQQPDTTAPTTQGPSTTTNPGVVIQDPKNGPITVGPQTSTETGPFATTTATIPGLTAHSVTTTSADDHATILPIWFVGAGVGIILIPGAGVVPGGIIPPPAGFPPLIIGPDGQAHPQDDKPDNDDDTTRDQSITSPTSTTSSCTVCATCVGFDVLGPEATGMLANDGDPDLPDIDPAVWSSMQSKYPRPGPTTTTVAPPAPPPTQDAVPIDQPSCGDASDKVKNDLVQWTTKGRAIRLPNGDYTDVTKILYMLRESVCGGTCTVPKDLGDKYTVAWKNGGACEVSVALSPDIELFVNSDTWPENDSEYNTIWQQCWDSTDNIINKCVGNSAKAGWWNGNHVYQFYAAGLRELNAADAHHTKNGISLGSTLEPTTEGLSCGKDCQGYIPNPQWCVDNCNVFHRRSGSKGPSARQMSPANVFAPRATQGVDKVAGCTLRYVLPDYPSSGTAKDLAAVRKFYDRDDSVNGNNNCDNPRLVGPVGNTGNNFDTEHVYEKHIIKRFFYYLLGGEQIFNDDTDPDATPANSDTISTCTDVQKVFNSKGAAGSKFEQTTAAQQIASAISCRGTACGVSDDSRLGEFFLLRKEINGIKNRIFAGYYEGIGHDANSNKLPRCGTLDTTEKMRQQMIAASMVFQYMNKQEVFGAFEVVHKRIRAILNELDKDSLGSTTPPLHLLKYTQGPNTWLHAYDEFMNRFLDSTEKKMELWIEDCKVSYANAIDGSQDSQAIKDAKKKKVTDYASDFGVYSQKSMVLLDRWASVREGQPLP